jgi:Flp pilus assembly pilin Flp
MMPKVLSFRLLNDERGQAVVEYILMLVLALSVVTVIGLGFRKTLFKLWTLFAQEISAACPGCPPDPNVKIR